jgi:mono/diheme cytochrome c family protein
VIHLSPRWGRALLFAGALLLAACGAAAAGDAATGEKLFKGEIPIADGNAPNCIGCHSVTAGELGTIGNNLSNIGNRAATTVPGQDAETYLRESILNGDAYLSGGYQEGIHYRGYAEVLSDAEVDALVAYMLTLQSGYNDP